MLTYSKLGINGRLGNQMFQFATTYAAAKRLGVNFFLYERIKNDASKYEVINDLLEFNVKSAQECQWIQNPEDYIKLYKESIKQRFLEPHFHYTPEFHSLKDSTDIEGYFQCEKYFSDYKSELCKLFEPVMKSDVCRQYEQLIGTKKYISVHVRRGDYVNLSHYHANLANTYYYFKAITQLKQTHPETKFLVFSDDVDFCKDYFSKYFEENLEDFEYVVGTSAPEEIYLQSLCFGNVIANSSFSWWGAWLNKNDGPVVAPKVWFGPDGPKDSEDIYAAHWTVL